MAQWLHARAQSSTSFTLNSVASTCVQRSSAALLEEKGSAHCSRPFQASQVHRAGGCRPACGHWSLHQEQQHEHGRASCGEAL